MCRTTDVTGATSSTFIYMLHCVCMFVAVNTAALDMLGGDEFVKQSRKPEVMSDAAYLILTRTNCQLTGQFLIDDEVLTKSGVTDLDQYSYVPGRMWYQ